MTYRAFFLLLVVLVLVDLLAYLVGPDVKLWAIVIIALAGIWGIWQREKMIAMVAARWSGQTPAARQRDLVQVEEWVDRPAAAARVGEALPLVPIRGGREVFRYPEGVHRTTSWMFGLSFTMVIISSAGFARDLSHGVANWSDGLGIIGFFIAAMVFFGWQTWRTPFEVEVTGEYIATNIRGSRAVTIPWPAISSAGYQRLIQMVVVRSPHGTIRFGYTIEGYGRLTNIVASHSGGAWRGD